MRIIRRLIIFSFIASLLTGAGCANGDKASSGDGREPLVIVTDEGEHRFRVEFADSDEERSTGLMYRTEMPRDAGMLFDFGEPQPVSMWMKNTLIPLDMAFINADGTIRRIASMTTPRSLASVRSGGPVVAVLEVNGGVLEELGVEAGDRVRHRMFKQD